jgi:chitodextrinase
MRPFTRSFTAVAVLLAFAGLAAGGSASSGGADVTLEGTLTVVHADDFAHGRSEIHASLDTGQATYALDLAPDAALPRASKVSVHGQQVSGTTVAVGKGGLTASPDSTVVAATTGAKKVLAILVKFTGQATPSSPTPTSAAGVLFTNANSVAAYYSTVSWGKLTLSGAVTPWVTIPSSDAATSCNWSTWGSQANTAAAALNDPQYNPSNYDYVQYVLNGATSCGWAGLAYLPGTTSWVRAEYLDLRVSGHELGHNFGTHHANSYSCTQNGVRVALSVASNCSSSEYGDPFSIMGQAQTYEHTNFSRGNFGFLVGANTQDVTSSGTYALHPIEPSDPTGVQALRISRGGGSYLLLEFRQPDGPNFDNFSSSSPQATGVTLRVTNGYTSMSQSQLVDTTPATGGYSDAPLGLNQSVYDPVSNATVRTAGTGPTGATVEVTFGPDGTAPSTPTGLAGSGISTSQIRLTWNASSDNVGVAGYRVYRDGNTTTPVGTTASTTFTDSGLATGSNHSYVVVAYDAAGNVSGPATTSASTQAADTAAPTAPSGLTAKKTGNKNAPRVGLSWKASTDDVGVTGYRVYRNGSQIGNVGGSSLSYNDPSPPKGGNAYYVVAVDAAANVSPSSNTVTVNI